MMYDIFEGPSNHTVICRLWEESRFIYFISMDIKMPRADSETYRLWYKEWYQRNRKKLIENARNRRLNDPEALKNYNTEYYKVNREEILEKRAAARGRSRKVPKPLRNPLPIPKPQEQREESPDKRKLPRPEYLPRATEELPFGFPEEAHKRKKLLEICPQGFLEEPVRGNPFFMSFS